MRLSLLFLAAMGYATAQEEIEIAWAYGMDKSDGQLLVASPGDELVFKFGGGHNVYQIECGDRKWNEFNCPSGSQGEFLGSSSPVRVQIKEEDKGKLCFYCAVGSHCRNGGQYSVVHVVGRKKRHDIDWKLNMDYADGAYISALPGDTLYFRWSGEHNVYLMDECDTAGAQFWEKFTCPIAKEGSTDLGRFSPVVYTVPPEGPRSLCFWCQVSGHCGAGQHSSVSVKLAGDDKGDSAPKSGGTTPTKKRGRASRGRGRGRRGGKSGGASKPQRGRGRGRSGGKGRGRGRGRAKGARGRGRGRGRSTRG